MNSPLAPFVGKNLPISVWNSKVLYLPEPLATAHKNFLNDKGWMSAYQPSLDGGTGGQSSKEAQDHVINRFLNSAARMQFVCADPGDEQPEVREMVLDQLGDGHIYLLDLAAGMVQGHWRCCLSCASYERKNLSQSYHSMYPSLGWTIRRMR